MTCSLTATQRPLLLSLPLLLLLCPLLLLLRPYCSPGSAATAAMHCSAELRGRAPHAVAGARREQAGRRLQGPQAS